MWKTKVLEKVFVLPMNVIDDIVAKLFMNGNSWATFIGVVNKNSKSLRLSISYYH